MMPQSEQSPTWQEYADAGCERARQLGNRGPIRFDANGRLQQDIIDAYHRAGFYVFTGVLSPAEIDDLTTEFDALLDNAPSTIDGEIDRHGRPVKFAGYYTLSAPRPESTGDDRSPDKSARAIVGLVSHPLMMMDSALRVYGHPQILRMVESINGADFIPFHESIFHKGAGEGPPTAWHQDGRTHWTPAGEALERADSSSKSHGFNLSVSWSHCTPENCLWVVPGSQRQWLLANGGKFPSISERLPEAVPMLLEPGDCGMVNRSSLHGSYPNRSSNRRITMVLGFHRRSSAIGTTTTNVHAFRIPGQVKQVTYSEADVLRRARMIPLAIDARRQKYPDETPYVYQGAYTGGGVWDEQARADISLAGDEYWQRDITL
jgi:hypothetical protein